MFSLDFVLPVQLVNLLQEISKMQLLSILKANPMQCLSNIKANLLDQFCRMLVSLV